MFFFFALVSTIGYSIQAVLMAHYARKMDALSLAVYRNASFMVTLLPLLIGTQLHEIYSLWQYWPHLLVSGIGGGVMLWSVFAAMNFIPLGVQTSVSRSLSIILTTLMSWLVFGEAISQYTWVIIIGIAACMLWLGWQRNNFDHLDARAGIGFALIAMGAIFLLGNKYVLIVISREVGPLVAAYAWEVAIALGALGAVACRYICTGKRMTRVTPKEFGTIALCAWPTLIGTGGFALAITVGPIAVVEATSALAPAITGACAWFWFKEKLHTKQLVAIGLIVVGIVALKLLA